MAISGGVDSMALAYLCSKVREKDPMFVVCDNPVGSFRGFVVDHGLRQESGQEAEDVCKALKKMGIVAFRYPINWDKEVGEGTDPRKVPNFESVARRARYRQLGRSCAESRIVTLLLGHHQDDQYETVLMRLVNGHRSRGLRGMHRASEIPECEGIHRAFNSGWVDDQISRAPYVKYNIRRATLKYELQNAIQTQLEDGNEDDRTNGSLVNPWVADEISYVDEFQYLDEEGDQAALNLPLDLGLEPMPIEDAGVNIYRPLLEFGKDRLVATCLANGVPWWEDHTNADPTLTMRNTLRDLARTDKLPAALRKPAILALSAKCEIKAQARDAEVDRWLKRTVLHTFEPRAGSFVIQFPDIAPVRQLQHQSARRYHSRIAQKRIVAGALVQRILSIASPDIQLPPLGDLQNVISRLFPSLASRSETQPGAHPQPFPIASVHFTPLEAAPSSIARAVPANERTWYVSRVPYTSNMPLPQWRFPYYSRWELDIHGLPSFFRWSGRAPWHFYDGRYWIKLSHRLPYRVVVMPFLAAHAKDFRDSLGRDGAKRLDAILKRMAPGKVRYTLPAIYVEEYLDLSNKVIRSNYPDPKEGEEPIPETVDAAVYSRYNGPVLPKALSKMRLLALPTLDIQVPHLGKWLEYKEEGGSKGQGFAKCVTKGQEVISERFTVSSDPPNPC
ncbi:uncharacterized protein PG998_009969 [Apiospora kogelbergensis]|uniref:uncharacterized protein n=1 Tax=Apiospora kogelbergensis TaxID=1337665 RepID=UPI003131B75D